MSVDTYALLREKSDKALSTKIGRDTGFPRGPAGKAVVLTHMKTNGFTDEEIEKASSILAAAGIR